MVNNYRPISLLSYLSKALEKLIISCFDSFFIQHGVLYTFSISKQAKTSFVHSQDYSTICLRVKSWPVVLLCGRKPHWLSSNFNSTTF